MGTCDVVSSCMCGGVRALAGIHPETSYLAELRDKTFVRVCVCVCIRHLLSISRSQDPAWTV